MTLMALRKSLILRSRGKRRLEGREALVQFNSQFCGPQPVSAALLKSINISGETTRLWTLLLTPQAKFCT